MPRLDFILATSWQMVRVFSLNRQAQKYLKLSQFVSSPQIHDMQTVQAQRG
jgi:hypothetical protein